MPAGTALEQARPYHSASARLLLGLLLINGVVLVRYGTVSEVADHAAWLTLLLSYGFESARRVASGTRHLLRALRALAGCAVLFAALGYFREHDWLDFTNAFLWIAVVVLLEVEVRWPEVCAIYLPVCRLLAACLYGALGLVVVLWLVTGAWFDAYDACVWLLAFGLLELNLLRDRPQ